MKRRPVTKPRHRLLVRGGGGERERRGREPGGVLRALEQEAVAVSEVGELVHQAGVRSAPPRLHVVGVVAKARRAGMQAQVVADGRAADLGAQQQRRRFERARGHDDLRRAHGHRGARAGERIGPGRLHARGAAALHEHALGAAPRHDHRTALVSIGQEGADRRLLGPGLVAEADVAGAVIGVALGVDVAVGQRERPAQLLRARLASAAGAG